MYWSKTGLSKRSGGKNNTSLTRMRSAKSGRQSHSGRQPVAANAAAAPANGIVDSIRAEDIGAFPDSSQAGALQRSAAPSVESLESVMVTGMRGSGPEIAVELEPWSPDRPYLHALDAAGLANFARAFSAQERHNGTMPVFYLDVAEWLFRKRRRAEAVEMLLSALELPARDTETIALVADRLMRYGQLGRAIWLYEEVCRLDPDVPQPARKLALALEQRALAPQARDSRRDLERALALLETVIMSPSDGAYEGIELVALMDANEIIPRLRALGSRKFLLDPRLVTMLDVDLRVVIEWNTGASDMDLWVDQPDGERSIYSNPETDIGGRLSNDMTSGYGPEEYLLRRAIDGEYAVRVNVYASGRDQPERLDHGDRAPDTQLRPRQPEQRNHGAGAQAGRNRREAGRPLQRRRANRSVAAMSSRAMLGSNAECPESGTMRRSASGHALCRSQAAAHRADHVEAALHDGGRDVADLVHVIEQLRLALEECRR